MTSSDHRTQYLSMRLRVFSIPFMWLTACGGGDPGAQDLGALSDAGRAQALLDLGTGQPTEMDRPGDMSIRSDLSAPGDMAEPEWCSVPDCYFGGAQCGCSVTMGSTRYTITCDGLINATCTCSISGANEPLPYSDQVAWFACDTIANHKEGALAACGARPTPCGSSCVDGNSDPANCGGCGNVCNPQQSCVSGTCQCPNGGMLCDGSCTDITTITNCDGCGNVCSGSDPHGVPACQAEHCTIACETGYIFSGGACVPGWTAQTSYDPTPWFDGVWGSGPDDLYVVGQSATVLHSSGDGTWQAQSDPAEFSDYDFLGVWGSSSSDIYVVGASGVFGSAGMVAHSTGDESWATQTITVNNLRGVWGSGPKDVYAVGDGGTILHSAGDGTWTAQTSGTSNSLTAVWGSGPGDVYVVGDRQILHSTGNGTWSPYVTGVNPGTLYAVWGDSATDVYAVGAYASILHSTGNGAWTIQSSPIASPFQNASILGIWGSRPDDVYAVAWFDLLVRSTGGGSWSVEPVNAQYQPTLYGVWGSSRGIYMVGSDNTILFKAIGP